MAFKMKGMNYGAGTGSATPLDTSSALPKKEYVAFKKDIFPGVSAERAKTEKEDDSLAGQINRKLDKRKGTTKTKTRKFLGRTYTKTKKFDPVTGKKIKKDVTVTKKDGTTKVKPTKVKPKSKKTKITKPKTTVEKNTTTETKKLTPAELKARSAKRVSIAEKMPEHKNKVITTPKNPKKNLVETKKSLPTYSKAYAAKKGDKEFMKKYPTQKSFETAAEAWWKKQGA